MFVVADSNFDSTAKSDGVGLKVSYIDKLDNIIASF
jgi:hypothetical protein